MFLARMVSVKPAAGIGPKLLGVSGSHPARGPTTWRRRTRRPFDGRERTDDVKPAAIIAILLLLFGAAAYVFLMDGTEDPGEDPASSSSAIDGTGPTATRTAQKARAGREERPPADFPDVVAPPEPAEAFVEEKGTPETGVTGVVLSPTGSAVRDAVVTCYRRESEGDLLRYSSTRVKEAVTTNARGGFEIVGLTGGSDYALRVDHGSFATAEVAGIEIEEGRMVRVPDVEMKGGVTIRGNVTRPSGAALAQAIVAAANLMDPARGIVRQALTDQDGAYRLENLTPGIYELSARAVGTQHQKTGAVHLLNPREENRQDFVLPDGLELFGRVLEPGGEPVAGVRVTASPLRGATQSPVTTTTRSDGWFRADGLGSGEYRLVVEKQGYISIQRPREAADGRARQFTLHRTAGVTGFVVDPGGEPITRFWIRALQVDTGGNPVGQRGEIEAVKSKDGSFTVEDLPPGRYAIQSYADGYAPTMCRWFQMQNQYIHGVKIRMDPESSITGLVTDASGAPFPDATVRLLDNAYRDMPNARLLFGRYSRLGKTKTDELGRYTFQSIGAGTYQVQASAPDRLSVSQRDVVVETASRKELDPLVLTEGGHLTGTVFGASNVPANGARVTVSTPEDGVIAEVRANDRGEFSIRNLRPGAYRLSAIGAQAAAQNIFAAAIQSTRSVTDVNVVEGQSIPITIYLNS